MRFSLFSPFPAFAVFFLFNLCPFSWFLPIYAEFGLNFDQIPCLIFLIDRKFWNFKNSIVFQRKLKPPVKTKSYGWKRVRSKVWMAYQKYDKRNSGCLRSSCGLLKYAVTKKHDLHGRDWTSYCLGAMGFFFKIRRGNFSERMICDLKLVGNRGCIFICPPNNFYPSYPLTIRKSLIQKCTDSKT